MTDIPDEELTMEMRAFKAKLALHTKRQTDQVMRIYALIELSLENAVPPIPDQVANDVLRAAVVLIHATLEDMLRTFATMSIPLMSEEYLNQVALAGSEGRAEKFKLGKLKAFGSLSVEDTIRQSVSEHLERTSFSSVEEITGFLKACFDITLDESVEEHFPALSALIKRRHEIVHRADRIDNAPLVLGPLCPIDASTVNKWAFAANNVMFAIWTRVSERLLIARLPL